MKNFLLVLVICIFSFTLLTYRITVVPPGINGDEAAIGYNAALLSKTLRDESGRLLPLFISPKTTDLKQPVYVYTMATLFKVFGTSYFLLRATSVLFVIVSIVLLYFLCREYYDSRFFVYTWVILITAPIVLLLSHWGAENVAPLPFVILWLWMMARFEKQQKNRYVLISGLSLGVSLFSYFAARAITPMLAVLTLVYIFFVHKRRLKKVLISFIYFTFGLSPFVIVLYVSKFFYPGAIFGNYKSDTLPTIYDFLYKYLSTFDLSFLFFKGDSTVYHSTGIYGMLLLASLPLFFLGVGKILGDEKLLPKLILASFFFGQLLFGFVPDIYRASRLLSIVPFYAIISAVGFVQIVSLKRTKTRIALIGLFFTLFAVNYYAFSSDYWLYYSNRIAQDFAPPENILLNQLKKGVKSDYKYYSGVQFFSETNNAK